jgi:hypothetical protein
MEASRVFAGTGTLEIRFLRFAGISYSLEVNHEFTKGVLSGPGNWLKAARMSASIVLHLEDSHAVEIRLTGETAAPSDSAEFKLARELPGWM